MITRPLDLASKLRPEPRNFDFLFFVSGGLIVMTFLVFGSSYVLSPGLGIGFQLQEVPGARAGATQTTHRITVMPNGRIYIEDGSADLERLAKWLGYEATKTHQPSLLIIASKEVPNGDIAKIANVARAAGFKVQLAAAEPAAEKH